MKRSTKSKKFVPKKGSPLAKLRSNIIKLNKTVAKLANTIKPRRKNPDATPAPVAPIVNPSKTIFVVQTKHRKWEDVTAATTRHEAKRDYKDYVKHQPNFTHRVITRRIKL